MTSGASSEAGSGAPAGFVSPLPSVGASTAADTIPARTIRVIVADDAPSIREALCDLLSSSEDIEVVGAAPDADQAVALALRERPDVVLVDVKMPGGGGPRAAREILSALPETKVLAVSAYEDRRTVLDMLREGAVGFVVKGTPARELIDAVRRSARGQGSLSAEITADVIQELSALVDRSETLARQLQDLNRDKSDMIQILSHELLTPVTVFQGFATIVSERWDHLRRSEFQDLAGAVDRAGERMRRLVGNLEAAARLDRDGMDAATRPLRVGELLTEAVMEFPQQSERVRLPNGDAVAGLRVWADPALAVRALVAVIENALALSPPDTPVDVDVAVEGGELLVAVSDRGPGVPEDKRDRIFDAFTQADSSTTRSHEGMGIGLYLTRRIMEAHGGAVDVAPREGGGSTFVLRFQLLERR
jgi:signal transduction histidine kinase